MADDNTVRSYRSSDPYRRDDAEPREQGSTGADPLAELARLIGQNDPFAEFGRAHSRGPAARNTPDFESPAPPTAPDWRASEPSPFETVRTRHAAPADPHFPPSTVPRHDQFGQMSDFDETAQAEAVSPGRDFTQYPNPEADERADLHAGAYAASHADADHDAFFDDGAPMAPQDEEMYDDAPRGSRGGKLLTAVVLVGCAMLGTAGAYGYRTYYVSPHSGGAAPVIVADKTPTKVVPATDTQSTKAIQDRIGDQTGGERMVSREEQPVVLKPAGTVASPRVVLPAPVAPVAGANTVFPAPPPTGPAPAAPKPAGAAPAGTTIGTGEPKRVRTVTIRPDGTDVGGRPVGGLGPTAAAPEPASARAAPRQTQTAGRGGPLSLDPQSSPPVAAAPATRTAAVTPSAPRLAEASASGGYVVQLSSQRSESEAHASFRSMQAKYPNLLNGHEPIVRRADLGAKGVFYRAMVGPFASAGEAGQFCSGLKAAGGQCIIHRN